ncbi:MAG: NYN domain-containing protein [Bacteroidota bacterium]
MRTIVYVDGFNFYYGLKKKKRRDIRWGAYYWIDLYKLFEQFLDADDTLVTVKYFTAPPLSIGKRIRQSALFKANDIINGRNFQVIKGKYIDKPIHCTNCKTDFTKPEEKRTDVNIAVNLIGDCALDNVDKLILVTADSDLVPPLEFIKTNYPNKKLRIFFPPTNYSNDLRDIAPRRKVTLLEKSWHFFDRAKMPQIVTKTDGTDSAVIPPEWI